MATWRDIGQENFRAAVSLYESGHYRSATSRFYYAAFSVVTHELIYRHASDDFTGGRVTPGHAQVSRLMQAYFVHFEAERRDNLIRYVGSLYRDRLTADYSQQRVDRQSATKSFRSTEKIFRYLEVLDERK